MTKFEARVLSKIIVRMSRRRHMGTLKYLSLILRFRNVAEVYKEETGEGKPFYYSRRFIGLVITVIFAVVTMKTGIVLDDNLSALIADNVVSVITALVALYGVVLGIIGHFKRSKKTDKGAIT